jgi:hypothetical protein
LHQKELLNVLENKIQQLMHETSQQTAEWTCVNEKSSKNEWWAPIRPFTWNHGRLLVFRLEFKAQCYARRISAVERWQKSSEKPLFLLERIEPQVEVEKATIKEQIMRKYRLNQGHQGMQRVWCCCVHYTTVALFFLS